MVVAEVGLRWGGGGGISSSVFIDVNMTSYK